MTDLGTAANVVVDKLPRPQQVATVEGAAIPVIQPSGDALMAMIERASRDPSCDIDKFERLMAMRERLTSREAEIAFNVALKDAQREMGPVGRNAKNDQTRSRYATLDAVSEAIDPIRTKFGFGLSYGMDTSPLEGHYRIIADLSHDGGHTRRYFADIPIDATGIQGKTNKTATHAFGSTVSYGRRYLKLMIFDVSTKDDVDGNRPVEQRSDPRFVSPAQVAHLRDILSHGKNLERFLQFAKLERLEDLPADDYEAAVQTIRQKASKRTAEGSNA